MNVTGCDRISRSSRALGRYMLIATTFIAGPALAQDVGTPPPGTNLQPQIFGPTPVNPGDAASLRVFL